MGELIAQGNRRRLLLEAATLNRQRRDAATKKGYVGHASTSAVTGGSRHRASDGSEHVTFNRRPLATPLTRDGWWHQLRRTPIVRDKRETVCCVRLGRARMKCVPYTLNNTSTLAQQRFAFWLPEGRVREVPDRAF